MSGRGVSRMELTYPGRMAVVQFKNYGTLREVSKGSVRDEGLGAPLWCPRQH